MKKNKLVLIIIISFISIFNFNNDVKAETKTYIGDPTNDLKNWVGKKCSQFDWSNSWLTPPNRTLSCLYALDIDGQCQAVQLNIAKDDVQVVTSFKAIHDASKEKFEFGDSYATISHDIKNYSTVEAVNNGTCPASETVVVDYSNFQKDYGTHTIHGDIIVRLGGNGKGFIFRQKKGKNLVTGEKESGSEDVKVQFNFKKQEIKSCDDLFEGKAGKALLNRIIFLRKLIQISVPLILIGMGVIDFAKAIISMNEDNMKKAQSKLIRRIIIGVAFFLIVPILNILLGVAHGIWPNLITPNSNGSFFCGII